MSSTPKQLSLAEVAKHNTSASKYIIIDDKVYDVTKFVEEVRTEEGMGGRWRDVCVQPCSQLSFVCMCVCVCEPVCACSLIHYIDIASWRCRGY